MDNLILHGRSRAALQTALTHPPQSLLLTGARGIGKSIVAQALAASMLGVDRADLAKNAYFRHLTPEKPESMTIDQVRNLEHFLRLKVPGQHQTVSRIAILEDAHLLTVEAQNALLKTLEEPPSQTVLILTAAYENALLPTIRSRVQAIPILRPPLSEVRQFFEVRFSPDQVEQTSRMAGGLPGLMQALLSSDKDHPLYEATEQSRKLLQATRFERLLEVDSLSKDRQKCLDIMQIMQLMSESALGRASGSPTQRWSTILEQAYVAEGYLRHYAQPKLVMTNFMLAM